MFTCHIGTRHLPGQIKHYVARSFRATIFNEPQLTTVGTAKGQPLAGCFWEQFASHCTNSTPNLLLKLSIAPEGMTFPLAEKLAVSHYISSDKPQQGQRDGWLSCFGSPLRRHMASTWGDYWQIGPIATALMAVCTGLPVTRWTAPFQFTKTNGATKSPHKIPCFQ